MSDDPISAFVRSLAVQNFVSVAASIVLALLLIWLARVLMHRSRLPNAQSRVNLESLLLNPDGSMDKAACIAYFVLIVTSWAFITMAMRGQMTNEVFGIYIGGWVTPILVKLFKGEPLPAVQIPPVTKPTQVPPVAGPPGQEVP